MAHCGVDFMVVNSTDDDVYSIDFVNDLIAGDTVVGATVTLRVQVGTDPDPASHMIGSEFITGGRIVTQQIRGLVAGNIYILNIVAITNLGLRPTLYALIPCEAVFS